MGFLSFFPRLRASSPVNSTPSNAPSSPPAQKSNHSDSKTRDSAQLSYEEIVQEFGRLQQQESLLKQESEELQQKNFFLTAQLQNLQPLCDNQNKQLGDLHRQLKHAQGEIRNANRRVHDMNIAQQNITNAQRSTINKQSATILQKDAEIGAIRALMKNKLQTVTTEYDVLMEQQSRLRSRGQDDRLQLEYLRCTTTRTAEDEQCVGDPAMPLAGQPFVVMLIDGDAYAWAHELFDPAYGRIPGALAATRLHNSITRHMLGDVRIPANAHIIVKVFVNEGGNFTGTDRTTHISALGPNVRASFRKGFTGAIPLFDFIDVGSGKERTDEKIHENFRIYLPNPYCHTVYLATCTDNGFARMLEPYQYHTTARDKIRLVECGDTAREIALLGFEKLTFPAVFAKKVLPPGQRVWKFDNLGEQQRQWGIQNRHDRSLRHNGVDIDRERTGMRMEWVRARVFGVANKVGAVWDVCGMMRDLNQGVGLRRRTYVAAVWDERKDVVEVMGEEGVD